MRGQQAIRIHGGLSQRAASLVLSRPSSGSARRQQAGGYAQRTPSLPVYVRRSCSGDSPASLCSPGRPLAAAEVRSGRRCNALVPRRATPPLSFLPPPEREAARARCPAGQYPAHIDARPPCIVNPAPAALIPAFWPTARRRLRVRLGLGAVGAQGFEPEKGRNVGVGRIGRRPVHGFEPTKRQPMAEQLAGGWPGPEPGGAEAALTAQGAPARIDTSTGWRRAECHAAIDAGWLGQRSAQPGATTNAERRCVEINVPGDVANCTKGLEERGRRPPHRRSGV